MAQINPPKRPEHYPDRDIDCQQAIETGQLTMYALRAGSTVRVDAIDQLTLAYLMGREEHIKFEAMLQGLT